MTLKTLISILQPHAEVDGDIPIDILTWDDGDQEYKPWPLDTVKIELNSEGLVGIQLRPCDPETVARAGE